MNGRIEGKKWKIMKFYVATNVLPVDRLNADGLECRPLLPKVPGGGGQAFILPAIP